MERVPTRPAAVPAPRKSKTKNKKNLKIEMPPNLPVLPLEEPQLTQTELQKAIENISTVEIFGTPPAPPPLSPTQEFLRNIELMGQIKEAEKNKQTIDLFQGDSPSHCPFHPEEILVASKEYCFYCPSVGCPVFCNKDNKQIVLEKLKHETSPDIRSKWGIIYCFCGFKPGMRLSRSEKNFNRVFLTCGNANRHQRCKYFQWTDEIANAWRPEARVKPAEYHLRWELKPTNQPYPVYRPVRETKPVTFGDEARMKRDQQAKFDAAMKRNNDERIKCGLMPYSRETYETYGTGIF